MRSGPRQHQPCSTKSRNLSTPRESIAEDIAPYWDGAPSWGDSSATRWRQPKTAGWIARLNSRGEILWDRSYAGGSPSELRGLVPTSDGGAVAFGRITALRQAGAAHGPSRSAQRVAQLVHPLHPWLGVSLRRRDGVARGRHSGAPASAPAERLELASGADSAGQVLWERILEIGDGFTLVDLAPGPAGGLYLLGTVVDDSLGESSLQLLYLGSDGSLQWDRRIGGSRSDSAGGVASFPDGRVVVADTTRSYANHPTGLKSDVWVLLLDTAGNLSWQRVFGDHVDDDVGVAIEVSAAGEVRVLASTGSFGNLFKSDYWLLAIAAADGDLLWQRAYRGQTRRGPRTGARPLRSRSPRRRHDELLRPCWHERSLGPEARRRGDELLHFLARHQLAAARRERDHHHLHSRYRAGCKHLQRVRSHSDLRPRESW